MRSEELETKLNDEVMTEERAALPVSVSEDAADEAVSFAAEDMNSGAGIPEDALSQETEPEEEPEGPFAEKSGEEPSEKAAEEPVESSEETDEEEPEGLPEEAAEEEPEELPEETAGEEELSEEAEDAGAEGTSETLTEDAPAEAAAEGGEERHMLHVPVFAGGGRKKASAGKKAAKEQSGPGVIEAMAEINERMPWTFFMRKRKAEKDAAEALAIEQAAIVLTPCDPSTGLTDKQVHDRQKLGLTNAPDTSHVRTKKQIVLSHIFTYFNVLNILLGVLIFTTGQYKNMLFLGVVVCNSVIGIVQELKVKQLIDRLSVVTAVKVRVLRSGKLRTIPVEEVVQDDLLRITIGDQIIADGKLIAGTGLEVNESNLTGESKPVRKTAGDRMLSGSFVVAGDGSMLAEKVGSACYASTIVAKTQRKRRASSEMQTAIGRIIKIVSVLIIPIGLLLFRSQRAAALASAARYGYDARWVFSESVIRTVSGIIGMIPEGLVLLTSVSFIIGVGRLAYKQALVQEMESIEALARADIICTDKTGTITSGKLEVSKLIAVGSVKAETIRTVMAHMNAAFTDTNDTQDALIRYFGKKGGWKVTELIPFSSDRKYRAVSFERCGSFVIGAPEFLVPGNRKVLDFVKGYSEKGYRCLLLARTDGISAEDGSIGVPVPVSIIVISDIIKEDAKDVFGYFAKAGVQVKVLSGDNPATVSAVAQKAGVAGADKYVDASTLPTNPVKLAQEISRYNVFGRVRPEQKQAFVHAWQVNGHTVAMVGDGVNDVLAIKDADCGIAMAKGSDAARQAAHIVLMNSDFSSMKDIVQEGKTIICNIERVSALYLTKTIYSALLSIIFILLASSYPWTTLQMGLINVIGIGMPSFLLTLERHEDWRAEGFVVHVLKTCLPSALTMVITVLLVQILNRVFGWSAEIYSYFSLMLGGLVAILVVAQVCWPLNRFRRFVLLASIAVFFAAILLLPGFYDIHSLWTPWSFLLFPLAVLISMVIYWVSRRTNVLVEEYELRHGLIAPEDTAAAKAAEEKAVAKKPAANKAGTEKPPKATGKASKVTAAAKAAEKVAGVREIIARKRTESAEGAAGSPEDEIDDNADVAD